MTQTFDSDSDPTRFIHQLQAEIESEAARRRLQDPELARVEREIERTWAALAPPGAVGDQHELLLDRAERLSMIDVDAPVGDRRGVRQVKTGIRKATYWYLRYVTDQLNALNSVTSRLLRRMDDRISRLEAGADLQSAETFFAAPPAPSSAVIGAIGDALAGHTDIIVASSGEGSVVQAAAALQISCYGVDHDPSTVVVGTSRGIDLRVGDPMTHLAELEAGEAGGVVLTGFVEGLALAPIVATADTVMSAVRDGGVIVVAVADPGARTTVERELLSGRGVGPETWAHLLEQRGCSTNIVSVDDPRIDRLVIATRS